MSGIDFKLVTKDKKFLEKLKKFFGLEKRLKNAIGLDAVAFSQDSFRNQGLYKKGEWPARKTPNLAGIWRDLNTGQQVKTRRFDPRPALVDTGALRNSITFHWYEDKMKLGTNRRYGANHQLGLPSTQTKNDPSNFNKGIVRFLRQNKDRLSERDSRQIYSLTQINELTTKPQKRRFLGYTVEKLKKIVTNYKKQYFR